MRDNLEYCHILVSIIAEKMKFIWTNNLVFVSDAIHVKNNEENSNITLIYLIVNQAIPCNTY